MHTSIKGIAAAVIMLAALGSASADDQFTNANDRSLHLAIALQGDQALVDIRSTMTNSIPQAMRQQMDASLPRYAAAACALHSHCAGRNVQLAALASEY